VDYSIGRLESSDARSRYRPLRSGKLLIAARIYCTYCGYSLVAQIMLSLLLYQASLLIDGGADVDEVTEVRV
jgi:hypothetical protein